MAKPTALTELNGAKLLPLIDSTATTSAVRVPTSIISANQTGGGDTTIPPGWMAVGTHRDTDTLLTPGGWTLPSPAPLVAIGGTDSNSATEGSRVVRPLRIHEGGAQFVLPGSSLSTANAYQKPLTAVGGVFTTAAATANQGSVTTTLASNFGYITDLFIQLAVTSANASTLLLLDASGGTALFGLNYAASALPAATAAPMMSFHFSVPLRANTAAASFFITTTGATTTWNVSCAGFFAVA